MRIIVDTEIKKAIVPKEFFENIRKINEVSSLTGRTKNISPEEYLSTILDENTKEIINEKDMPKKPRKSRKTNVDNMNINNVNTVKVPKGTKVVEEV